MVLEVYGYLWCHCWKLRLVEISSLQVRYRNLILSLLYYKFNYWIQNTIYWISWTVTRTRAVSMVKCLSSWISASVLALSLSVRTDCRSKDSSLWMFIRYPSNLMHYLPRLSVCINEIGSDFFCMLKDDKTVYLTLDRVLNVAMK